MAEVVYKGRVPGGLGQKGKLLLTFALYSAPKETRILKWLWYYISRETDEKVYTNISFDFLPSGQSHLISIV